MLLVYKYHVKKDQQIIFKHFNLTSPWTCAKVADFLSTSTYIVKKT